ncbi:MAG: methylase [Ignavibacteria bacterium]|nr:methylase [Ignavibacteria bacterium]
MDKISNQFVNIFNYLPARESTKSLELANKIKGNSCSLNSVYDNIAGVPYQKHISTDGDFNMVGGAEFDRIRIKSIKGHIDKKWVKSNNAFIKANTLIVQNIIAHIIYPIEHIKITACIPSNEHIGTTTLSNTVNQLILKDLDNIKISNKYTWCILNSKLINWYVYRFVFSLAIRTMHFYSPISEKVPFIFQDVNQQPFITLADTMLEKKKELHQIRNAFLEFVIGQFVITKQSTKLQDWYILSFEDFLKELEKAKVKLTATQKFDLNPLFEREKTKALEIKLIIDKTDKEIDKMVYEIYGLTEEEIKIVEGV